MAHKHVWLPVVAAGLLLYGGWCFVESTSVRQQAESLPQMTCGELARDGPAGHRFVILIDIALSDGRSVSDRDGESGALEMYHPVYPANKAAEPAAVELTLVLCIMDEMERRRVRDDRNRRQELGQPGLSPLTVEVGTTADKLPAWAQEGLADRYRGILLSRCRVVTIGHDEPTAIRADHLKWRGLGVMAVAGVAFLGWLVWPSRVSSKVEAQVDTEPSAAGIKGSSAAQVADSRLDGDPNPLPVGSDG